jgi:hypothetical protein
MMSNELHFTGAHVIEHHHLVAIGQKPVHNMTTE